MAAADPPVPALSGLTGVGLVAEVATLFTETVALRRHFHSTPELSFQEVATAARIAAELRSYPGIDAVLEGCGRTGVVGLIHGGAGAGPCIAMRADMDALPIQEESALPYASKTASVMHACGHDGHCAGLLAAAKVLAARKASLRGTVKLMFQPAEEGYGGAKEMIADGVLEEGRWGPRVDSVWGAHLWSYLPLGVVATRHGPIMAASDRFEIEVKGSGGHGAAPQGTVDSIVVASHLVTALQTIVSRNTDPLDTAVVTVGRVSGGYGYNIIAPTTSLMGTCRSFVPATQDMVIERMGCLCKGVGAAFGADVQLAYHKGYPPTINSDAGSVDRLVRVAAGVVGEANVQQDMQTCGAEDFSYFLQQRPGCLFFPGAALPGPLKPHHRVDFDFDERAMAVTASIFVRLAEDILGA